MVHMYAVFELRRLIIQANFDHLVYFILILGISLKSVIFLELHVFRE